MALALRVGSRFALLAGVGLAMATAAPAFAQHGVKGGRYREHGGHWGGKSGYVDRGYYASYAGVKTGGYDRSSFSFGFSVSSGHGYSRGYGGYGYGYSRGYHRPVYVPPVYCPPPVVVSPPVYYAPPVYVAPQPVYVQPAPVVYQPAPVVYQPAPIIQPAPIVIERPVIIKQAAPVVVEQRSVSITTPEVSERLYTGPQYTSGVTVTTNSTTITSPAPVVSTAVRDIAPGNLSMSAFRSGDTIIVAVTGTNPSDGFATALTTSPTGDATLVLRNQAPSDLRTQKDTPFAVNASVRVSGVSSTIAVRVADQVYSVPVADAPAVTQ